MWRVQCNYNLLDGGYSFVQNIYLFCLVSCAHVNLIIVIISITFSAKITKIKKKKIKIHFSFNQEKKTIGGAQVSISIFTLANTRPARAIFFSVKLL